MPCQTTGTRFYKYLFIADVAGSATAPRRVALLVGVYCVALFTTLLRTVHYTTLHYTTLRLYCVVPSSIDPTPPHLHSRVGSDARCTDDSGLDILMMALHWIQLIIAFILSFYCRSIPVVHTNTRSIFRSTSLALLLLLFGLPAHISSAPHTVTWGVHVCVRAWVRVCVEGWSTRITTYRPYSPLLPLITPSHSISPYLNSFYRTPPHPTQPHPPRPPHPTPPHSTLPRSTVPHPGAVCMVDPVACAAAALEHLHSSRAHRWTRGQGSHSP